MSHDSLPDSVKQLSEDLGDLIRKEMQLARTELAGKAKTAGVGAGMLSGSAIAALLTLGSLTALAIIALSIVLAPWLSALIVTVAWGIVAAVLGLAGKQQIQNAGPLVPEQTISNVKEDVEWIKNGVKSRR
jgi:hypothetical protein